MLLTYCVGWVVVDLGAISDVLVMLRGSLLSA